MKIKTLVEFMSNLKNYFGNFQNETVQALVMNELIHVKPSDYDRLFEYLLFHFSSTWKIDVKVIHESISALKLELIYPVTTKCPVCGTIGSIHGGICAVCKYAGAIIDGDPQKYKKWWLDWQKGKAAFISPEDIQKLLKKKILKSPLNASNRPKGEIIPEKK